MARPRTFSNEKVVQIMNKIEEPFCTASDLAEELNVTNATILDRLNELEDENVVKSKRVGSKAKVYWVARQTSDAA